MARKTSSKHKKDLYQRYKSASTYTKNRLKKLQRHVKNFPEDVQAVNSLDRVLKNGIEYRRKRPVAWAKKWSPVNRDFSQLLRKAGFNGNIALEPRIRMMMLR